MAKKIDFPYEVVRTNRKKTAAINVNEGQVQIVVPMDLGQSDLEGVVYKKRYWVREKLRMYNDAMPSKPKEYVSGECFTYLGKNYKLKLIPGGASGVKLKAGHLEVGISTDLSRAQRNVVIKEQLTQWYKSHAETRLKRKVLRLAKMHGLKPKSVSIKDYKSRWGSCSSDGEISFNWKVIIAPHPIVDYVVAHELCHMLEHNHSPAFWKRVERIIPDYRDCKEWLKVHSGALII